MLNSFLIAAGALVAWFRMRRRRGPPTSLSLQTFWPADVQEYVRCHPLHGAHVLQTHVSEDNRVTFQMRDCDAMETLRRDTTYQQFACTPGVGIAGPEFPH